MSNLAVYAAIWCWLGVGADTNELSRSDAPTFRNAALVCLGVGGFCSLQFHLLVKLNPTNAVLHSPSTIDEEEFALPSRYHSLIMCNMCTTVGDRNTVISSIVTGSC